MTDVTHYHPVETSPPVTELQYEGQPRKGLAKKFDVQYIKTPDGLLKVVEIALGFIVFICAAVAIRHHPVFYGCAVWAVLVGFFSMLFTLILLVLYCLRIPSSATSVPWNILGIAYAALMAVFFLIAGVMLAVVAESAITRPRISYYTSSLIGEKFVVSTNRETALPPLPDEPGYKREWLLQKSEANYDEFRPATAGAVFAFAATLVYAADVYLSNSKRASDAAAGARNRSKGAAV